MESNKNDNNIGLLTNKSKNNFLLFNSWYSNLYSFLISYLVYYVLSDYTSNIVYYESTDCISLLSHCKFLAVIFYYYAYAMILFLIFSFIQWNFVKLKLIIQSTFSMIVFVYLILITIDLFKGESCGDLRTIAIIWCLYEWFSACCLCCIALTIFGTVGFSLLLMSNASNTVS